MNCPNCGHPIEDNSLFCTNCGGKLENLPSDGAVQNAAYEAAQSVQGTVHEGLNAAEQAAPPAPAPYVNTAALAAKPKRPESAPKGPKTKTPRDMAPCRPLSTWGYVWRTLLFAIPVVGLVLLFVFAFSKGVNENSRSYARSWLIYLLAALAVVVICAVLCYIFRDRITEWLVNFSENLRELAH